MARRYVVGKKRAMAPLVLPRDEVVGHLFLEADGTILEVTCSGKMPSKDDWPEGGSEKGERMPAHGHSHRPRHTT